MGGGCDDSGSWDDSAEADYNYLEMLVLMTLLLAALTFETVWHRVVHTVRKHAYEYGSLRTRTIENFKKEKEGDEHPWTSKIERVKLMEELVNRAGGEFMTLGFLAFCTFMFNNTGGFKWLVRILPPDAENTMQWPASQVDWLHLVELVHMNLFIAMVLYFSLIARVIYGAVFKIEKWEHLQHRFSSGEVVDMSNVSVAMDRNLTEYLVWRNFFIKRLISTEERRPVLFKAIMRKLKVRRNATHHLLQKIEECFNFSAYISLNVEIGVRDSIEVHPVTWFGMIVLFAHFAVLHRFAKVTLRELTPGFIGAALLLLGVMRFTVQRHRQWILDCAFKEAPAGEDGHAGESEGVASSPRGPPAHIDVHRDPGVRQSIDVLGSTSSIWNERHSSRWEALWSEKTHFHERFQTELLMHRVLQIILCLICYVFARTLMDFHDWQVRPALTGLLVSLFTSLFALLVLFLPTSVPVFLAVMALPPYVDDGNLGAFFGVLGEGAEEATENQDDSDEALQRIGGLVNRKSFTHSTSTSFASDVSKRTRDQTIADLCKVIKQLEERVQNLENSDPSIDGRQSGWRSTLSSGHQERTKCQQRTDAV